MKRASFRAFVCALLASLALTTFVVADSGSKPQLTLRVKNAPQDDHIQAVTSATITSKAVTGAVNEALALAADLAEEAAQ